MIVVLSGGTGGARFLQGLQAIVPERELTVIVNTGDDLLWWGLHVSPDIDSVTYGLAGLLSRERGWGVEADSFHCLETMRRLGAPGWFQLGDRDLAVHLARTRLLADGKTLTQVTAEIAAGFGIQARILAMSDARVETRVQTEIGDLGFQEYFVRERCQPRVRGVRFAGAEQARPAPGVLEAIAEASVVLVAPSNPITSIGPILAVPGISAALAATAAPIAAVSPIVGGAAVRGPAGELMRASGLAVSAAGVAEAYHDFLDVLVADDTDITEAGAIESLDVAPHFCATLMTSSEAAVELARQALGACEQQTGGTVAP